MLILIGKPKGNNGHRWNSPRWIGTVFVRNFSDDAEVPQPWSLYSFIYSFLQQIFLKQLLHALYSVVRKSWSLTLKIIHHYFPILETHDHIVTDCPKSEATSDTKWGKGKWWERKVMVRLGVLYCTSNPFFSPEQTLVSASADTVAGRYETSSFRSSSLLIWCSWALIVPLLLKLAMPTKVWISTICIK